MSDVEPLVVTVLRQGDGERPSIGHLVTVRVSKGRLKESGDTVEMPELLEFTLGEKEVIAGLETAVAGMSLNECAELVIPCEQGYGRKGYFGVVPPKATLMMNVELLGWV
mmetsp:Transcript_77169/g.121871  ORF Transcript_77169/g.121871 Transcript_77169/m.121871 type:complete len:110 (-) Transcript_77169:46-375(-)|eukprot:CAMPEP_0169083614 /NCGR_PEP_ID=MMETSP1015-20121227/12172_1 /TAXON_ID=342587 /ORGANISM="Karlodinium micrum, Strain CCMP2283" /LENGTH=109 /DNA_ID=CAMNT_0009143549 /DNA_START=45 /DNA_END=374 /DNA_ORIENTATION=-